MIKTSTSRIKILAMLLFLQVVAIMPVTAQILWPEGQLLPSFPATAKKQDFILMNKLKAEQMYLFASLKGIVNRTQPRIFSYEGDAGAEGPYTWMRSLDLSWTDYPNQWDLITKYRSEIKGLIVYDPEQIHTVNLATARAKDKKALIVSPYLATILNVAPYNLPILIDMRGKYTNKLQVYQELYDTDWLGLKMDKRLLIGLNPKAHQGAAREYAVALGAATIWLDPRVDGESQLLNKFLGSMTNGGSYMGWWPEEASGVGRGSQYGIATIASDWSTNLTVHSGMPRNSKIKPIPPKPVLQNKIYVAFIYSDGDNLQYVEHLMRKLWNDPDRGTVPIGWTISPAMVDAMPGALNFYQETATPNDNLISGPSGFGYAYPNTMTDDQLKRFVLKTDEYNKIAGLRVITIWNTIVGGINKNVGEAFAAYAPSTLGITGQDTNGPVSIYNNSLPGFPLSCNYCWDIPTLKGAINYNASRFDGTAPVFILLQSQPWRNMKPSDFKILAGQLSSDYVVVRPDHFFQLLRESKGLPVDSAPSSKRDK